MLWSGNRDFNEFEKQFEPTPRRKRISWWLDAHGWQILFVMIVLFFIVMVMGL